MKIAIGAPALGPPAWGFLRSLLAFQTYHYDRHPDVPIGIIQPPRPLPIGPARQWIADRFLETDYDYLWWLDQDARFLPGTLDRLMSWDKGIVGALCMMRKANECLPMAMAGRTDNGTWKVQAEAIYRWTARRAYDPETNGAQILESAPPDALLEIDFTGCHCLLTKREVYEAFHPHFVGTFNEEDVYFCLEARKAGFVPYMDMSVLVGHVATERTIGLFDFYAHYRFKAELLNARHAET